MNNIFVIFEIGFFTWILVSLPGYAIAQELPNKYFEQPISEKTFDGQKWEEISENIRDRINKDMEKVKSPNIDPASDSSSKSTIDSPIVHTIIKVVIFIVVLVFLIFLIQQLVNNSRFSTGISGKTVDNTVKIHNIQKRSEETPSIDFNKEIAASMQNKEYDRAIRFYFLFALHQLKAEKLIAWKKQKTNKDYLTEIEDAALAKDFGQLATIFEMSQYSDQKVEKSHFEKIEPIFRSFIQRIREFEIKHK